MSDLERRLRDALHGVTEAPPDGLTDAVLRRHRRHRVRLGGSLVAVIAAVAIAVPQLIGVLRPADGGGGRGFDYSGTTGPLRPGSPAPGTVLDGCANSNIGQLGRNWKTPAAFRVGPVWVIPEAVSGGSPLDGYPNPDDLRLATAIIVLDHLRPGSVVVVRVPHNGNLRFLYGKHDSLAPGTHYTLRSGEAGVTFVSCSRRHQTFPAPYTDYLGGFLLRGPRCVRASVEVSGWSHPRTIRLGDCPGR